jgi:capsular polysaccharide biosynthesis protein
MNYTLFRDDPVPSLNETMRMFHSAVMVVAPHGAGESNVVFSIPGIHIIEILCKPPAKISLSFKHTAHVLGHHWHGIMSRGGCPEYLDVEPSEVDFYVRYFLKNAYK